MLEQENLLGVRSFLPLVKTKSGASPLWFFAGLKMGNLVAGNFCSVKMHWGCLDVYELMHVQL